MGNRVCGHHQLEAVDARQEVVVNVCGPAAFLPLFNKSLVDKANDCADECACADRRIEYLDFVPSIRQFSGVSKTICESEIGFENIVYGADDKSHDWKRGIVRAHFLAKLGIVLFQEVLVKMDDRILALRRAVFLEILL